jgi:hypothetical protein
VTAIAFGPVPSRRLGRSLGINNILDITAVHPMREDAVADLLARTGQGWPVVEELVRDGRLARREHAGRTFFVRRFARPAPVAAASATPERVR